MNIFVTNQNPELAAKALDDKRIVKMVLESAQMLSTAINMHGGKAPYKSTHVNHPANVWARANRENFKWLYNHFVALSNEYGQAYNKHHKCSFHSIQIYDMINVLPEGELTPFANCAAHSGKGISFKHLADTLEAYRRYLIARWNTDIRKPTWTNRNMPTWVKLDNTGVFVYSD